MIPRKFLSLTNLSEIYVLIIHELLKAVLINKDKYFVFATLQVVISSLKSLTNI